MLSINDCITNAPAEPSFIFKCVIRENAYTFFFNFPEIDFFCMLVYKSVDDCRPTRFKLLIFIIFQGNLNSTSFLNRKKEIEYKNMVLKL